MLSETSSTQANQFATDIDPRNVIQATNLDSFSSSISHS